MAFNVPVWTEYLHEALFQTYWIFFPDLLRGLIELPGRVPLHRGRYLDRRVLHHRDAKAGQAAQLRAGDLPDGEVGS